MAEPAVKTDNKIEIELKDVYKSYYLKGGEEVPVLRGVTLQIKKGEFVAIMGESGCGKTTLMNILGCLHPIDRGEYLLSGEDLGGVDDDYTLAYIRNKRMGFIFQQFNLLGRLNAIENVALPALYGGMPRAEREEKAVKLLNALGMAQRVKHKPNELSGGQQQRIAVCRALINDPEIILADEPTGALDSKTGLELMGIFQGFKKQGKTLVMVTHTPEVAKFADRIIYMRDGKVMDENYKLKDYNY
jgi:putative ABC transport system ATP-binding protein